VTGASAFSNRDEVARWLPAVPREQLRRAKFALVEVDSRLGSDTDLLLSLSKERGVVPRAEFGDPAGRADSLSDYKVVKPGQIVMNKMQAWNGVFGLSDLSGVVSPDYSVFAVLDGWDPRYVTYLLRSDFYTTQFGWRSRGMGTAFLRLHPANLLDTPLVAPSHEDQSRIADYLDTETARIDALTSRYLELVDRMVEQRGAITVAGVGGGPLAVPRRASSLAWLSEVPAHWDEVRLSLLARLGSGHTPSREHPEWWIDCTIPWITTGEVWQIRDDRIEYLIDTREMISQIGLANSSAELHPAGTVVLSRTASAGFSAIMATDMATSQDYVTWTGGPRLRPRFLLLCLRAMRQDLLGRLAMGSTHQTIYVPDIQSIRIPLPPLEEQDQLVEWVWQRLRRIDAATDAIRSQIELLLERRQALITAAVTGQLDIPGVAA